VLVGTPDHWHALTAIAAMEAGADLYLQKPISVDVVEGKAILNTARRLGRVVQVGTQRRSTPHLIEAKQRFVDAGRLGKVGHIELFSYYRFRLWHRGACHPEPQPVGGGGRMVALAAGNPAVVRRGIPVSTAKHPVGTGLRPMRIKAGRALGIVGRIEPIPTPFIDVAGAIEDAVTVRGKAAHRAGERMPPGCIQGVVALARG
jgi:hypothetical protein